MLYIGKNVFQNKLNILAPHSLAAVAQMIRQPAHRLETNIRLLRRLRSVDPDRYRDCKRYLPYFIGAHFRSGTKRVSHFLSITHFVIDIDGPALQEYDLSELKAQLATDARVAMAFVSPGGEGLKLVFTLAQPITDCNYFSQFYRAFVIRFFADNDLPVLADTSTSDVTRICFLSADAQVFFREAAEKITAEEILSSPTISEVEEKETSNEANSSERLSTQASPLDEKLVQQIKGKLNPEYRPRGKMRQIYVPPIMETVREPLTRKVTQRGVHLSEIRDIHYGHKYVFTVGGAFAELNIYHGIRGFTVVKSPKRGHHPDLTDIVYQLCSEELERIELGIGSEEIEKIVRIMPMTTASETAS